MKLKFVILLILINTYVSCNQDKKPERELVTKRVGMVIKLKEESLAEYKKLHADGTTGVRDLLMKYNLHNFSIFLTRLEDGNYYEFGYYEYTGEDFDRDMRALSEEPRNIEWLKICDPMQEPIGEAKGWKEMETVYFNP